MPKRKSRSYNTITSKYDNILFTLTCLWKHLLNVLFMSYSYPRIREGCIRQQITRTKIFAGSSQFESSDMPQRVVALNSADGEQALTRSPKQLGLRYCPYIY